MEKSSNIISFTKVPQRNLPPNRASHHRLWNFAYPHQVVSDPGLSLEEKRAILAAWASDIHAVESLPILRHLPGTPFPVTFSSVMDAMARLDRMQDDDDDPPPVPVRMKSGRPPPPQEAA